MRFIPHSNEIYNEMLSKIGVKDFNELVGNIPKDIKVNEEWDKSGLNERELKQKFTRLSDKNISVKHYESYLGGGAYEHFIPSAVKYLASLPQFVTSYTQYQPESNQGMLQALFEFQTMMCRLTKMDISTSSHYDGATSLAEAARLAYGIKKGKIVYSYYLNPFYKSVLKTYFQDSKEIFKEIIPSEGIINGNDISVHDDISAIILQTPNFLGLVEDINTFAKIAKEKNALLIVFVNPISLGILKPPGDYNADIVVGEGQPLGNELNFGGPYFGFFCVKNEYARKIPGRVIGQTVDKDGKIGYVLTLQTREQHIRREKATSNICTNQALCALKAGIFMSYYGDKGFINLSRECFLKSHFLFKRLTSIKGVKSIYNKPFFNEFVIQFESIDVEVICAKMKEKGILAGINLEKFYPELKNSLLISVTETKNLENLYHYVNCIKEILI